MNVVFQMMHTEKVQLEGQLRNVVVKSVIKLQSGIGTFQIVSQNSY